MSRKSLAGRAIVAVLVIEAICAVAFISTALLHEWRTRLHALDAVIQGRSDSLMGAVQDLEDPGNHVFVDPQEFSPSQGDVYAVFNPQGLLVGESKAKNAALQVPGKDGFRNMTVDGRRYRVLQRQALRIIDREETNGVGRRRPVTLVYAVSMDRLWSDVLEATSFYALVSLVLLCASALVLIWMLRRLLTPLRELAVSASEIKADSLEFAAPTSTEGVRELTPLTDALSAMIARVRAAFDSQHRFIHDAAHELKTAVAIVRSTIQVMAMRERSVEEYRKGLNQVLADNERVEELVQKMLTLASAEERGNSIKGECELGGEVSSVVERLRSVGEARGVRLRLEAEQGLLVGLSAEAISSLVSNLILNAVQHSPAGAEVGVGLRCDRREPQVCVLEVRDVGSGIDPRNLERIFERFYREDPSRSRETGGIGLGLSICKSIVDAANGIIEVESTLGKGTTVFVRLPLVETAAPGQTRSPRDERTLVR